MALPKEHTYTMDDIYALPDGERAELINGQIYYMTPPSRKHQIYPWSFPVLSESIYVPIKAVARYMRLHLQYIWMKHLIPMLNRTFP